MRTRLGLGTVVLAVVGIGGGCQIIANVQNVVPYEAHAGTGGAGGTGGTGGTGGMGSGGSDAGPPCVAGGPCYTGMSGTEGVGLCKGGTAQCNPDGTLAMCVGEVTPVVEDCAAGKDQDCNGTICGEALWAYDFQGPTNQYVTKIVTDTAGNIYLSGKLGGSITFGTNTVVANGGYDAFVAKLDPSGAFVWGMNFGDSANNQAATAVAVDADGNVALVGWFFGSMTIGAKTLTGSTSKETMFVARFDPMGTPLWAFAYGNSQANRQVPLGVGVDKAGDVVATGWFTGAIDFGTGSMTAAGTQDLFVAKFLGSTGAAVWSHNTGLVGVASAGNAVAVDGNGNAVVVGTSSGAFAERHDAMGNQTWSSSFNDNYSVGAGVALDGAGNAYVTGTAKTIASKAPTFVAKLDVLGNQMWAVGAGAAAPFAIAVDTLGNSFIAGSLNTTADFGGGALTGPAFLWKLNPDGTYGWSRAYGTGTGTSFSAPQACMAVAVPSPSLVVVGCENSGMMDFGASTGPVTGSPPAGGFPSLNVTLAKIAAR